ncbi:uncharacterized protein [Littorina saxatilis]|uniref:uncharacterized protein n=1 Tax=Littorina saxatilis TaxID=31220 RepID=UPI0038B61AD7
MDSKSSTSSASMDKLVSRSLGSKKMLVMIVLTVLAACVITGTSAASVTADCPIRSSDPSMVELFFYSDFVVLAKVLRHIKASPDDQSFTAQMELYCIFKGKDLPRTLNVSSAVCFHAAPSQYASTPPRPSMLSTPPRPSIHCSIPI